ncbi:hypothetical protein PULV_a1083 [Pseudoalteromonas ulvae UL12]|uniref:GNAT family N-acetyltransferase/peptidase C39 family protein n=1 Tax=Pseudoalteromonas ulvae TaxID=107327 RepID=UPI00186B5E53|nr:GNAT family N-acetyltransferase/peptidase C39 family protein [Pseudoalteromonas ulvae]MBE0363614.1 hypothetical protein [Pseudoalteromonas ulvae UL12]
MSDLTALEALENTCFSSDKISRRSFLRWLKSGNCLIYVAEQEQILLGYGLVLLHKGTQLARLYSLAISPNARGLGIAKQLLAHLELAAADSGRLFMRLEVAKPNLAAISLYQQLGYKKFGEYSQYYHDHSDALRMQKRIRNLVAAKQPKPVPWYQQTTEFTCGPASLMMAMASLDTTLVPNQMLELDIWREATTIFMTSGHGGCHPLGLAIAAKHRGYPVDCYISHQRPLFIDGVRSAHKKEVMQVVEQQFRSKSEQLGINVHYQDFSQIQVEQWLQSGYAILILISTYRMDGRKVPHWVAVTAIDEVCLYVHDPDPDDERPDPLDCQHLPIARADFDKMSQFGSDKLRTCVVLKPS